MFLARATNALESTQLDLGNFARAVDQLKEVDLRKLEAAANSLARSVPNLRGSGAGRAGGGGGTTPPKTLSTTISRQLYTRGIFLGIGVILIAQAIALVLLYKYKS